MEVLNLDLMRKQWIRLRRRMSSLPPLLLALLERKTGTLAEENDLIIVSFPWFMGKKKGHLWGWASSLPPLVLDLGKRKRGLLAP